LHFKFSLAPILKSTLSDHFKRSSLPNPPNPPNPPSKLIKLHLLLYPQGILGGECGKIPHGHHGAGLAQVDLQGLGVTADRFLDKIGERCQTLAQFPNMGLSRDELHPGLRSLPVGKYLIFYIPIEGGIEIVRVLPGMMDIDAVF
jgi:toxin ParE1/3/4